MSNKTRQGGPEQTPKTLLYLFKKHLERNPWKRNI